MVKIILGKRIGKTAKLIVGCSAVIFGASRLKVLLTRRADNGLWCLPGGHMEPGESAKEACIRETLEETGLTVDVIKLIGVYSSPDRVIQYEDSNLFQPVSLTFEAVPSGGILVTSSETTAFGYFSLDEIQKMDLMIPHYDRVVDAFSNREAAFIR